MEKLAELLKNRKFLFIFSGFIILVGLILIFRKKEPQNTEIPDNGENELKAKLKEQKKTLKELERKNKELEEKARGKSIAGTNSKRIKSTTDDSGEKGKGETAGLEDDAPDASTDVSGDEPTE